MHVHNPIGRRPRQVHQAARFRQAQAGERDSLNGLMVEHDGLVRAVVRRRSWAVCLSPRPCKPVASVYGAPFWAMPLSGGQFSPPAAGPV
jgi:hypothetical protein